MSFAASRRIFNQWVSSVPSRFVDELPKDQVEVVSDPGLFRAQPGFGLEDSLDAGLDRPARQGRGPGYQRLKRARRSDIDMLIEGTARRIEEPAGSLGVGVRVFHQKFGYGTIVASDAGKLEIAFEKAGTKKVMESFVMPA